MKAPCVKITFYQNKPPSLRINMAMWYWLAYKCKRFIKRTVVVCKQHNWSPKDTCKRTATGTQNRYIFAGLKRLYEYSEVQLVAGFEGKSTTLPPSTLTELYRGSCLSIVTLLQQPARRNHQYIWVGSSAIQINDCILFYITANSKINRKIQCGKSREMATSFYNTNMNNIHETYHNTVPPPRCHHTRCPWKTSSKRRTCLNDRPISKRIRVGNSELYYVCSTWI